ncbi:MAG TPA: GDSL-type esterase/lipase family protein [Bacillota bacterium]|nr:GDSL-type esterase/lipase family protein [Bacillota bacterium]
MTETKIVAIGDSITYGYPYSPRESWTWLAFNAQGICCLNKGEPGETSGEMRARFTSDVILEEPSHVIIMGGTNDSFYNLSLEIVCNNIDRMCQQAVSKGITPIVGIPIPVNEQPAEAWMQQYRTWLRTYANRMGFQQLDFYQAVVDQETGWIAAEYHDDGVHPNLAGYQKMASIVKLPST